MPKARIARFPRAIILAVCGSSWLRWNGTLLAIEVSQMRGSSTALAALLSTATLAFAAPDPPCPEIYLISPYYGFGSRADSTAEIFVQSAQSGDYELRGILFKADWGVFKHCSPAVAIKVRWLRSPGKSRAQKRVWDERPVSANLDGRSQLYFELGWKWGEVSESTGKALISEIEKKYSPSTIAGRDFERDRYGMICRDCDVRPPEAAHLRP
jgi:hypothetical protein